MLQPYLPGVRIWLDDVDEPVDVDVPEKSVVDSEIYLYCFTASVASSLKTAGGKCPRPLRTASESSCSTRATNRGFEDITEVEFKTYFKGKTDSGQIDSGPTIKHILREDPILWLGGSTQVFALTSVNMVVLRLLQSLPYYDRNNTELHQGLHLGSTLNSSNFSYPSKIFACKDNAGILDFVDELEEEDRVKVSIVEDDFFITHPTSDVKDEVILLYLNDKVFQDTGERVSRLVLKALEDGNKIVLVQEKDADKGHCEFEQLIYKTPQDLLALGVYSDIAIPLYTTREYRKISMHLVLKKMSEFSLSGKNKKSSKNLRSE